MVLDPTDFIMFLYCVCYWNPSPNKGPPHYQWLDPNVQRFSISTDDWLSKSRKLQLLPFIFDLIKVLLGQFRQYIYKILHYLTKKYRLHIDDKSNQSETLYIITSSYLFIYTQITMCLRICLILIRYCSLIIIQQSEHKI